MWIIPEMSDEQFPFGSYSISILLAHFSVCSTDFIEIWSQKEVNSSFILLTKICESSKDPVFELKGEEHEEIVVRYHTGSETWTKGQTVGGFRGEVRFIREVESLKDYDRLEIREKENPKNYSHGFSQGWTALYFKNVSRFDPHAQSNRFVKTYPGKKRQQPLSSQGLNKFNLNANLMNVFV